MAGRSIYWWCVVGLLAASGAARANRDADALESVRVGVQHYNAGEYAAARDAFARARDLVPSRPGPYRWLGLTEARLGRCKEATLALDFFLGHIPPDDPRRAESQAARDGCRSAPGALAVESQPAGAEVRLDDGAAALGRTPWRGDAIAPGPHVVHLSKEGFDEAAREVAVERGATARVQVTLTAHAAERVALALPTAEEVKSAPAEPPRKRTWLWITIGAVAAVVVLGLGLGLGLGLSGSSAPQSTFGNIATLP